MAAFHVEYREGVVGGFVPAQLRTLIVIAGSGDHAHAKVTQHRYEGRRAAPTQSEQVTEKDLSSAEAGPLLAYAFPSPRFDRRCLFNLIFRRQGPQWAMGAAARAA